MMKLKYLPGDRFVRAVDGRVLPKRVNLHSIVETGVQVDPKTGEPSLSALYYLGLYTFDVIGSGDLDKYYTPLLTEI